MIAKQTLSSVLNDWIAYKTPLKRPSTIARYRWLIALINRYDIAGIDITEITPIDLHDFAVKLSSEVRPETGNPYGKNTVINALQVVKMTHKWAAKNGFCAPIIYDVELPRTYDYYSAGKLKCLTPAQADTLMDALSKIIKDPSVVPWVKDPVGAQGLLANNVRYALGCVLGLGCGLRIGEVCAINVSKNINTQLRQLNVESTLVSYIKNNSLITEVGPPKTDASVRMVPIPPMICKLIVGYAPARNYLIPCDASGSGLPNKRGLSSWYSRLMRSLNDELPYISFHGLRHTYATRLLLRGADFKTLAELLGHADVTTTMRIYAHPDDESKADLIDSTDW